MLYLSFFIFFFAFFNIALISFRSNDEGNNWEQPKEITPDVKPTDWKWYATGPVHAIQLEQPKFKNRIVIPCNHTTKNNNLHISHVIYSDNNGETWKLGGSVPNEKTDECTVTELSNGSLLLNMRNNDKSLPNRKISKNDLICFIGKLLKSWVDFRIENYIWLDYFCTGEKVEKLG